ncbi:hypothetical protein ACLOJK_040449 [Asimina triloba]
MVFSSRDDVKGIDNPERDIWGVPERWLEPLPDPIPRSHVRLSASQRGALIYFRGTALHWFPSREEFFHWCKSVHFVAVEMEKKRVSKRAYLLEEGSILVGSNSSVEDVFELSPLVADRGDRRRAVLSQESVAWSGLEEADLLSDMSLLREELEVSRAEVALFQSLLRGDDARSSAMVEYLQSTAYRCRVEFKRAHHSQDSYVRALSDVTALYSKIDLSSLYQSSSGRVDGVDPPVVTRREYYL